MITIAEVRRREPYYNKFSDKQIADAIYKKHYSHAPREEFNKRIGYQEEPEQSFLNKLPRNIATGVAKLGQGLANTPHNVANLVGLGDYVAPLAPTNFDYGKALGLTGEPTLSDEIIQGLTEFVPSIALPGANIGRAGKALGSMKGGKFLKGAAEQAIPQALFGATQAQNPIEGAALGGAGSVAGSALGSLLEKGINAARPSRFLRGNLSPEQLARNLENTAGTQTGLGQIIENPTLNRLHENVLPHVIGSGTEDIMQKTANQVAKRGEALATKMLGGQEAPEHYGIKLKEALKEAANETTKQKTNLFGKVNQLAENAGVTTTRPKLRQEAQSILKQIESDPDLAKFTNSRDIKLVRDIANPAKSEKASRVNVITGKPLQEPKDYSLKNTDILRGKIGELAHEATVKGEAPKAEMYKRLKKALENDVEETIENSSIPELKEARKEAMKFYKNDYTPFKDKDIRKFIKEGGDPDLIISHFLRLGKNDRSTILNKLQSPLASKDTTKNLLGNAYLSSAFKNGQFDPVKFSSLYHKLGTKQREALFSPKFNKELASYSDLVHKNKEGFNLMFNPKTGARLSQIAQVVGGVSAGGTGLESLLATALSGRAATKLLTSEKIRTKLVNAMIRNKTFEIPKIKKLLEKSGAIGAGLSVKSNQHQ